MEKTISYGRKKMCREDLDNSLDTSWLYGDKQSSMLFKPNLDLSRIATQNSMHMLHSSWTSFSVSQSFEDMSFFRSEFTTPRVIKANHDVKTSMTSRPVNKSFIRSKPRVFVLKKRTVPENIILDCYPKLKN